MANTIPPELQTALNDFDATITAKPNLTDAELLQKFPEFKNDAKLLQAAHDYSATKKSGKYKDVETLNSKFPEFDESNYKSNDLKKKDNSESPSPNGTSPKGKMSFAEWKDSPEYSENSSYDDYLKGKTTQKVDYVSQLKKLGIPQDKIDQISNMSEEQIRNLPGIPKEQADKIISVHSQIKQQNAKVKTLNSIPHSIMSDIAQKSGYTWAGDNAQVTTRPIDVPDSYKTTAPTGVNKIQPYEDAFLNAPQEMTVGEAQNKIQEANEKGKDAFGKDWVKENAIQSQDIKKMFPDAKPDDQITKKELSDAVLKLSGEKQQKQQADNDKTIEQYIEDGKLGDVWDKMKESYGGQAIQGIAQSLQQVKDGLQGKTNPISTVMGAVNTAFQLFPAGQAFMFSQKMAELGDNALEAAVNKDKTILTENKGNLSKILDFTMNLPTKLPEALGAGKPEVGSWEESLGGLNNTLWQILMLSGGGKVIDKISGKPNEIYTRENLDQISSQFKPISDLGDRIIKKEEITKPDIDKAIQVAADVVDKPNDIQTVVNSHPEIPQDEKDAFNKKIELQQQTEALKPIEQKAEEKPVQAYDYDKTLQNEDGSLTDLGKEVSTRKDKSDIHIITGNPDKAMIAEKLGIDESQIDVVEGSEEEKANAKAKILSDLDEKQGVAHFVDDNKMNRQKAKESGIDKVQTPEENLEEGNKLHPDWEKEYEEKPKEETKPIEGEDTDTSLKRAVADNEKSKREGTEAVGNMVNALQSTDVKEAYNNAKTKVDNKEIDPDEVTERVNKNNTGSLEDEAILLYDRARLRNEEIKLIKDRDNSKTKAERDSISDKLQNIWEKQADNDLAAAKLGREASNLFRLRKAYVDSEFSIYSMEREFKSAHNLTELTPEQKEHIKNQREEMIKADAKINELREQLKTEKAARKFAENALNEAKKQAKEQAKSERKLSNKAKIDKSKVRVEQIKDRIKGIVREQMKTAGAIPVNPELAAEIAKLAKEKVYQGAVKLDDVVKDILDELKDVLPDWTKKDVLDHLAYKNERKPISEETKIGQKVKKSAQLQKQIEEGADNFVKPEKRSYLPSQNLQDAMAEYERLKWQWKNELHRAEMKNRHWSEKTVDKIIKARTGIMLLSGVKTLAKLFHYTAMETLVGEPVDMLMTGLSQLLGPVAKKSLVEGHFDLSAEGEFYKTFGKKQTYKEIKEYAKSHQAQIDLLYGKITQIIPEEFRVSGGFLHGLEKYPLRKATFTRDYIKLAKSYEKMGFDPTDPATEKIIGGMAMNKANYRIMMSQNKISTLLNAVQSRLRSPDMGKLGKIGFYASKILFPIMRVPTNFTIKTLRSWGGLAEFGLRMTQGVSKMTPEEADNAILAFKNGVPGAAIGLAVLGSNVITTDDQGRLEIGGWKVPNFLTHHPMIMTAKLFADAKKEWNKKGGTWYDATLKPAFETAKETPYFGDQMLSAISDQNKFKQFIQNTAITFMEPQLMKDIASIPDHEQKTLFNMIFTDPTYRKPQDFIDKLKLGIPGLRETVVQPKEQEIIKKAVEERVEELKTPKQQDLEERQKRVDEIIKKNNKSHTYINKKGEKIDLDNATDKELDYIEDETQTQAEKDEKEVKKKYAKEIEEKAQKQINQ